MAAALKERLFGYMGGLDAHIAVFELHVLGQFFNFLYHGATIRQPQRQTRADLIVESENFELSAQLAVVAFGRFLLLFEVIIHLFLCGESRAVNPLQHGALFVSAPVGSGDTGQLESPHIARRSHMRATAKVNEVPLTIKAHRFVRDVINEFHLVRLACHDYSRFCFAGFFACERQIFGNNRPHNIRDNR